MSQIRIDGKNYTAHTNVNFIREIRYRGNVSKQNGLLLQDFQAFQDIVITSTALFEDITPATTLDSASVDFSSPGNGQLRYDGLNDFNGFLSFFPYLELVSAGTNGIELRILKNGTPFITIEGRPEMTANAIPYILKRPVSLVTGDILTSQIRNDASTIDIRVRAFGLRVEAN